MKGGEQKSVHVVMDGLAPNVGFTGDIFGLLSQKCVIETVCFYRSIFRRLGRI